MTPLQKELRGSATLSTTMGNQGARPVPIVRKSFVSNLLSTVQQPDSIHVFPIDSRLPCITWFMLHIVCDMNRTIG